ncbi:MAG: hypothetical protein CL678_10470 [Bdellovibrionaceae bacterium]|nr:hypothetical protein [Pseudobdellovibrionaceae bacterium]
MFRKSILNYEELSRLRGEKETGVDRPFGQDKSELCILYAQTATASLDIDLIKACKDAVLYSAHLDPKQTLRLTFMDVLKSRETLPFQERVCEYHRFLRRGRLAEIIQE